MIYRALIILLLAAISNLVCASSSKPPSLSHKLAVHITPKESSIAVTDHLVLPKLVSEITLDLNSSLKIVPSATYNFMPLKKWRFGTIWVTRYKIQFRQPSSKLDLQYKGIISTPFKSTDNKTRGGRAFTQGVISSSGIFLDRNSYWYPTQPRANHRFSIHVDLPQGWRTISQGAYNAATGKWASNTPQEEIYLIGGQFHQYSKMGPIAQMDAYLLQDDTALANRYLLSTQKWLSFYDALIGPYPYPKFALVENFWESGYGMPSFTLLGSRVIRFPFILYSSYPHEILHNWWGNGVYVDTKQGNWSEGLTTYLADHLIQEQQGRGAAYRRKSLIGYATQVAAQGDFPIKDFKGNSGHHSQSIGYGKTLMLFHMLRRQIGDAAFIKGLKIFFKNQKFKASNFASLQTAFEASSAVALEPFFTQWLERIGAPKIELTSATLKPSGSQYLLTATIEQTQDEDTYQLRIPYLVQFRDGTTSDILTQRMDKRATVVKKQFSKKPARLIIDPEYDLFRQLDNAEIPSQISQLFASEQSFIILPTNISRALFDAYQSIATVWSKGNPGLRVIRDDDINSLPKGNGWIFGVENRFKELFDAPLKQAQFKSVGHSVVLVKPHGENEINQVALLTLGTPRAAAGMARKLPHYGKYSYLVFEGNEPKNSVKGEWPTFADSMSIDFSSKPNNSLPLPNITPQPALSP